MLECVLNSTLHNPVEAAALNSTRSNGTHNQPSVSVFALCVSVETSDNMLHNQELTAADLSHLDSLRDTIALCQQVLACHTQQLSASILGHPWP